MRKYVANEPKGDGPTKFIEQSALRAMFFELKLIIWA